ncbi:hypothetical protein MOF38_21855, partial [Bacillus haynesii]|uniref:hypothetical protein n=1 Tax=Bacillus haynesii TaxID=1925021 RepID=UPI00227E81BD
KAVCGYFHHFRDKQKGKISLPNSGATIHSSKNPPYKNPSFLQTLTKAYPIFGFLVNVGEE